MGNICEMFYTTLFSLFQLWNFETKSTPFVCVFNPDVYALFLPKIYKFDNLKILKFGAKIVKCITSPTLVKKLFCLAFLITSSKTFGQKQPDLTAL